MPDSTALESAHATAPANGRVLRRLLRPRTRRILLAFFLLSFAVFLATATGQFRSIDDENLYSTAHSLTSGKPNVDICRGTNQAADYLYARGPYGCLDFAQPQLLKSYQKAQKKYVSKYGIGVPVIAAPFFGAGRVVGDVLNDHADGRCRGPNAIACCKSYLRDASGFRANCQGNTRDMITQTTTLFTNSLVTALTLVIVMIVCLQLGASLRGAALIGVAFAFGSYAFAYAKTLAAEPGTAMCVILAVMFGIEALRSGKARAYIACGLAAGAAVLFRSTALIFLPVFGVWFLIPRTKADWMTAVRNAALFSVGAIFMLLLLVVSNTWRYGSPTSFGYNQTASNLNALPAGGPILTGIWGQWLSPGKSIFLYAPFVLLAIAGIVISVRRFPRELVLLIAIVVANTLMFARVRFWSGDWAWGPRYMIIVLPCLAVMCAPLVSTKPWRNALAVLAGLGFLFPGALGVLVNYNTFYHGANRTLGVTFRDAVYHDWSWNPIWHHVKILGQEWGNFGRPYGLLYMRGQPRLDVWWLDDRWWISGHPGRFLAGGLLLLVIAALAIAGAVILRNAMRRPVVTAAASPTPDPPSPNGEGDEQLQVASHDVHSNGPGEIARP